MTLPLKEDNNYNIYVILSGGGPSKDYENFGERETEIDRYIDRYIERESEK